MRTLTQIIIMIVFFQLSPTSGECEAIQGFASPWTNWGWNFADSAQVSASDQFDKCDFVIFHGTGSGGGQVDVLIGYVGIAPCDSLFEDVTVAPENDALYTHEVEYYYDQCYFVKTVNGCYAKIKIHYPEPPSYSNIVEYVYQTNGSRVLQSPVSIKATTWGGLKAIYRSDN